MSLHNKFEQIQAGNALLKAIEEAYATSVKPGARFKQRTAPTAFNWQQQAHKNNVQPQQPQQAAPQQPAQQQTQPAAQQAAPQQSFEQSIINLAKDEMNREQILNILKTELRGRGA